MEASTSYKPPKGSKKHRRHHTGDFSSVTASTSDPANSIIEHFVQNGEQTTSSSSSAQKQRKKRRTVSEATNSFDPLGLGHNGYVAPIMLEAPSSGSPRKKHKKHHHVTRPFAEETLQEDEFVIEEDDAYRAEELRRPRKEVEEEVAATPKKKHRKRKKDERAVADQLIEVDSVLASKPAGFAPITPPSRPSLSLMANADHFFAPLPTLPSFVATPKDIVVTSSLVNETDHDALLKSFHENQTASHRRDVSQRKEELDASRSRRIEPEEVIAARRQNQEDNEKVTQDGFRAVKTSSRWSARTPEHMAEVMHSINGLTHEEILSTTWLDSPDLAMLSEKIGLVWKGGKFSKAEDTIINYEVQLIKDQYSLSHDGFVSMVNPKRQGGSEAQLMRSLFVDITRSLGLRALNSVYLHMKRMFSGEAKKGKWTEEEDHALKLSVERFGPDWGKASEAVGRPKSDCRDRWRNILSNADERKKNAWTAHEEYDLVQAVRKVAAKTGVNILTRPEPDVGWTAVSQALGNTRSRLSCKTRWADITYRLLIGRGQLSEWTRWDERELIKRIYKQDAVTQAHVQWGNLLSDDWCCWSSSSMRKRYQRILKSNKQALAAPTHKEQIAILYKLRVEGVDPDNLERPPYTSWKGLKTLPDLPIDCFGKKAKRLHVASRLGEIAHTSRKPRGAKEQGDEDTESDENEEENMTTNGRRDQRSFGKSSEFIEDSDEMDD